MGNPGYAGLAAPAPHLQKMKKYFLPFPVLLLLVLAATVFSCERNRPGQSYSLVSPDGRIAVTVTAGNGSPLQYRVSYGGKAVFLDSPISMTLAGGNVLGRGTEVEKTATARSDKAVKPLYSISDTLRDRYNELTLHFKGNYAVTFRAYNEGMAYRFVTRLPGQITVESEEVQFNLAGNYPGYFHPVGFESSSEEKYAYRTVADQAGSDTSMTSLPVLLEVPGGPKIALLESDLLDYAGLYLTADAWRNAKTSLPARRARGLFPGGWRPWCPATTNCSPTSWCTCWPPNRRSAMLRGSGRARCPGTGGRRSTWRECPLKPASTRKPTSTTLTLPPSTASNT